MAKIINTQEGFPQQGEEAYHVYNGLDSCLTLEIFEKIYPQLDEVTSKVYRIAKDNLGMAMGMMLRGIKIDRVTRDELIHDYRLRKQRLQYILDYYTMHLWGIKINAASPKQKKDLLYKYLKLPITWKFDKGTKKISTDRDTLEKLQSYWTARPFIKVLLALADVNKTLGTLNTSIDHDGRIRAGFNVAGTETGRMASRANCFGTGTNLQNITEKLRKMFVADEGKRLSYIDLEQAESRAVGIIVWKLFGDSRYIDACESGDLHTLVCRMVWKNLTAKTDIMKNGKLICQAGTTWGNDLKVNKAIASQIFYRDFSYRDMAKRAGHGTNYFGKPPTMAKHLKVDTKLVENFQRAYFKAFPGIKRWHRWVAEQLQTKGYITTFMGRRRFFFGRQTDDTVLRAAIAYEPQSAVADIMNKGLLQVTQQMPETTIHAQVHDAGIFQYDEGKENVIIPKILSTLEVHLVIAGRDFVIPNEALVGWNWGYCTDSNPEGLILFTGNDKRTRSTNDLLHRTLR